MTVTNHGGLHRDIRVVVRASNDTVSPGLVGYWEGELKAKVRKSNTIEGAIRIPSEFQEGTFVKWKLMLHNMDDGGRLIYESVSIKQEGS